MTELKEEVNCNLSCADWSGVPMRLACVAGVGGERVGKKSLEVKRRSCTYSIHGYAQCYNFVVLKAI